MSTDLRQRLIDVDDCVLVVIDVQDYFLDKIEPVAARNLVERVAWLACVAELLEVPVVAMAEDIAHSGGLNPTVAAALPSGVEVFDKNAFGLADNPEILAAVAASGRQTAVLVGLETDVCVAQSALGLRARGFQVAVLQDAVATTPGDDAVGLARMREAGVVISSVKALYYEWLRSVSEVRRLDESWPDLEGVRLPDSLKL